MQQASPYFICFEFRLDAIMVFNDSAQNFKLATFLWNVYFLISKF